MAQQRSAYAGMSGLHPRLWSIRIGLANGSFDERGWVLIRLTGRVSADQLCETNNSKLLVVLPSVWRTGSPLTLAGFVGFLPKVSARPIGLPTIRPYPLADANLLGNSTFLISYSHASGLRRTASWAAARSI